MMSLSINLAVVVAVKSFTALALTYLDILSMATMIYLDCLLLDGNGLIQSINTVC